MKESNWNKFPHLQHLPLQYIPEINGTPREAYKPAWRMQERVEPGRTYLSIPALFYFLE